MSISCFTGEREVPLRGDGVTDAILELLAVTLWEDTEILVIDMPPGCGDEILDVVRFIPKGEMVLIANPGVLSRSITQRTASLLTRIGTPIAGVICNMDGRNGTASGKNRIDGIPSLGTLPYAPEFEDCIGSPRDLRASAPAAGMITILDKRLLPAGL
jgi:ATP-binding protein involved in chromosome partitioning